MYDLQKFRYSLHYSLYMSIDFLLFLSLSKQTNMRNIISNFPFDQNLKHQISPQRILQPDFTSYFFDFDGYTQRQSHVEMEYIFELM